MLTRQPTPAHLNWDVAVQLLSNQASVVEVVSRPVTAGNSVTEHHSPL